MAKGPDCKSEARESVREFESPPVLQIGDEYMWGIVASAAVAGLAVFIMLNDQNETAISNRDVVCIEGVQYYMIREYQKGFMSPVYDHTTLQIKTNQDLSNG